MTGFLPPDEQALCDHFVAEQWLILPVEDTDALARIRDRAAALASGHLGLPLPNDPQHFLDRISDRVSPARLNDLRLAVIQGLNAEPWFRTSYHALARRALATVVGNELVMQRTIGLSVQLPADDSSLLPLYADVWDGDSPYEVVLWLPLVDCLQTKSMCILPHGLQLGEGMREADQIPEAKMMEIADDLIAMGVKAVTFSGGGEPLLYKPLPAVIDRLAAGGIRIATLTNGSNLKGRVGEALARHATWVRISVDAWDDASYTAARGAPAGAFTQLLANVRDFKATGTRAVLGVSLIVSKDNAARVFEIASLFKEAGASHVKLSAAVVANDAAANNAYHREFRETVEPQIARCRTLGDGGFSVLDHYHEMTEGFEKSYDTCPYQMFLTVIGADQHIYTCQDKAYAEAGDMGSIEHGSFRELWFSDEHRDRLHAFDPRSQCRHHCVTHAKNLSILEYLSIDPEHAVFV